MKFADLLSIARRNLLKLKLRTVLTVAGVVIAIAAFVSMLSFGAGNQQLISEQYDKFGLFFTMQVFQQRADVDSTTPPVLDRSALILLGEVPGVRMAYPFDATPVDVEARDTTAKAEIQAMPVEVLSTQRYSHLVAGSPLSSDSARTVMVNHRSIGDFGQTDPDSMIGERLILTTHLATLDSAILGVFQDPSGEMRERFKEFRWDSVRSPGYLRRTLTREAESALGRFVDGFINARTAKSDTVTVCGVFELGRMGRNYGAPLIVSLATLERLTSGGISASMPDIVASLSQGQFPRSSGGADARTFPRITLDLDPDVPYNRIRDSVKALGFRTFSYVEQFAEIQQFFLYFNMALGLVGLIALLTASLGIANTLIMATIERRREIGVLKSLGADDSDIRRLFFVESGVIGLVGAILGVLLGWGISRAGAFAVRKIMESKGSLPIDPFAVPLWLILTALAVGVTVAVIAGYYPASRAARINPVDALRGD